MAEKIKEIKKTDSEIKRRKIEDKKEQKKFNEMRRKGRVKNNFINSIPTPSSFRSLGLLSLIFVLLCIGTLFRISNGYPNPSFSNLLDFLGSVNGLHIDLSIPLIPIGNFPDWLGWLASVINALSSIINFVTWIVTSLIQILGLIFSFLTWLLFPL